MTRTLATLLLVLLAGCGWSNSLYHARRLSASALKAEREERSFEAGSMWGQAAVKADSARARSKPQSDDAIEARWLRGRALAHLGSCTEAVVLLDEARIMAGDVDWRDDLALELARCKSTVGGIDEAIELITPLLQSPDNSLRDQARNLGGRILLRAERWGEAERLLADDETSSGRWLYAVALARLGRADEAVAIVTPMIESGDRSRDWPQLVRAVASHPTVQVDTLLSRLGKMPLVSDTLRAEWLMAAADGAVADRARSRAYLESLARMRPAPAVSRGRSQLVTRMFSEIHDDASMRSTLARVAEISREDAVSMMTGSRLSRWTSAMLADIDSIPPGAEEGDLAMFHHASIASDTLGSPQLASWFLQKLERDWPASPYVAKALLWRIILEPDSADAFRERLALDHADSPYLAWIRGVEDPRFAELEYTLDFYLGDRLAGNSAEVVQ
jgi:tetratricopeptide (TPR) repeat protein